MSKLKRILKIYGEVWRQKKIECVFSLATFLVGYGLIAYISWEIAVGIFLISWSNNLDRDLQKKIKRMD